MMLIVIAAVYACMELRDNFPKGSDLREGLKTWHFMLGLSVLLLVAVRLVIGMLSAEGKAIPFFFVQLPALVNQSKSVADDNDPVK